MRIAIYQMHVRCGNPVENLASVDEFLRKSAAQKADLAVLPEMWPTGFDLRNAAEHLADPAHKAIVPRLCGLARELGIDIMAGSMLHEDSGKFYNHARYISRNGAVAAEYSKMHLYPLMDEDKYLTPGNAHGVFQTPFCPAAMAICYDLRFPELFRRYALDGARLVIVSAEWPAGHINAMREIARVRALENQYFLVLVNSVGQTCDYNLGGMSAIYDAVGRPILECGGGEEIAYAEIDLAKIDKARKALPALKHYRADIDWLPRK
jgi:predicted amidohydrolase